MNDDARFLAGLATPNADGCVEWARGTNSKGYGKLRIAGRTTYAHRYAYERVNGPILAGLTIDHLCRNKRCCNPEHLEAVTLKVNIGRAPECQGAEVCSRGHAKTPDNVWRNGGKGWKCKECHRELVKRRYHEKRSAEFSGLVSPL